MNRRLITRVVPTLVALVTTLAVASLPASAADPDPATPYSYNASAGGTFVRVFGDTASSDPTSASGVDGSLYPADQTNTAASVHVGTLVNAGAISTEATAAKVGTDPTATATAETANASLLNGLIKLDVAKTITDATRTGTTLGGHSDSELVGLTIKGKKFPINVSKNFGVKIPGVASIVLNEQNIDIVGGRVTVTGSALKVTLLKKYEGSPTGSTIAINPTSATLKPTENHGNPIGGFAYGTYVLANIGDNVTALTGATAPIAAPQGGTFGYDIFNRAVGVNLPLVVKSGVVQSRANAMVGPTTADVTHENKIVDVNVLNGLIKASAITATARSNKLGFLSRTQTASAELVDLVIGGKKIALGVPANTTITIPKVIKVVINEQTSNTQGIQDIGLHVTLLSPKSGLKAGAEIFVAVATAITY